MNLLGTISFEHTVLGTRGNLLLKLTSIVSAVSAPKRDKPIDKNTNIDFFNFYMKIITVNVPVYVLI